MKFEPHVTVATVVERDGQYLLVEERAAGKLVLNQPAGHLEAGESLQQAALRETLEETGWEIELTGLLGLSLHKAPTNGVTYQRTTFVAQPVRQQHQDFDDGIERVLWLDYETMCAKATQMRSPLVIASVERARAGICHPLDLIY